MSSEKQAQLDAAKQTSIHRTDLKPANASLSLGVFIAQKCDETAQLAMYRNIGNRALGQAIYAAQRIVRDRIDQDKKDGDDDRSLLLRTLDRRNEQDAAMTEREPPVGLEPIRTAREDLAAQAAIYATANHHCLKLAKNEYDLPQSVDSRIGWVRDNARRVLRSAAPKFRDSASTAEKLAFVSRIQQAKTDWEFWSQYDREVAGLVLDAVDMVEVPEEDIDVLDSLTGVDAHQYAIQAGIGLQQTRVRLEQSLTRFPAHTIIGRQLVSDMSVLEMTVPKVVEFVDQLEAAYTGVLMSAIEAGRNLLSSESIKEGYTQAVDRAVTRAGELLEGERKRIEAEIAETLTEAK